MATLAPLPPLREVSTPNSGRRGGGGDGRVATRALMPAVVVVAGAGSRRLRPWARELAGIVPFCQPDKTNTRGSI